MLINIYSLISSESAATPEQGNLVYEYIEKNLKETPDPESIIFDFDGIDSLTTAFLNNCLGRLFSLDILKDKLLDILDFKNISNNSQVKSIRLTLDTALLDL
ncbi:hypothetical protein UT300003_07460 [Clostridium sardiniense]